MTRNQELAVWAIVQLGLLVATFFWEPLGTEAWHHLASLGLTGLLAAVYRRQLASRRFLSTGVLASTVLATISGFYLLYWKEGIRADGYQDWGVWWHVFWSWIAMVFFFQHTWVNRIQYVHFFRQSLRRAGPAMAHMGGYALLVAAFFVTWSVGAPWFTNANYIQWTLATWLVVGAPIYVTWLLVRLWPRPTLQHWPARRAADLALVPASALAVISGLPLLFMGDWLDAHGFKYVSKYWHVWPSVVFAVIVFVHSIQAWRTVKAHWKARRGLQEKHPLD